MNRLSGKVALVTGGGSGIGRGIVDLFAAEGAKVAVLEIEAAWAAATEAELKGKGFQVIGICGDVSLANDVKTTVERAVREWGGLDVLVNNAATPNKNCALVD